MSVLFLIPSDAELAEITMCLKHYIMANTAVTTPHKIMVFYPKAAQTYLRLAFDPGAYVLRLRLLEDVSANMKERIEIIWDRHKVPIEIVRDNGTCGWFTLPREAVISRNLKEVALKIEGED